MIECPVEGCDYSGPKKSVLGHYSGKSDGLHPGGYQKAKSLLGNSDPQPEPEPQQPKQQSKTEPQSQPESKPTGNPTFGSAEPQPEPEPQSEPSEQPSQQQGTQEGEYLCLECNGPVYDFTQYKTGQYHAVNGHQVYVLGDYQCAECGKWWVDE